MDYDFIRDYVKVDVKYYYDDNHDKAITFNSFVKKIEEDYIVLDFLQFNNSKYIIPDGKEITVHFKTPTGYYFGNCYILGKEDSDIPGVMISYPPEVEYVQQREYVRVPLHLRVEILAFLDESGENVRVYEVTTLDISGSGFCYVSDDPLIEHNLVKCLIYTSAKVKEPVEINLKHVYSKDFLAGNKKRYKNAFTYVDIDSRSREKILKEIFLYQMEMTKKGFKI